MLLFAGSLAAAPPKPGDSVETRNARTYTVCMDLARNEPAKAQALASTWEKEGGGEGARHCAAVALLSGGQYDRDAGRVDALVYRATAWRHIGNLDLALDDARRALKIAPGHLDALLESGIVRRLQGDAAGAAADWRRLIDIDPRAPAAAAARENLGRLPK